VYMEPFYAKRRAILKSIPNFWPQAFGNLGGTSLHMQHAQDQDALSYLEDLWVSRDTTESRCFTLEFVGPFSFPSVLSLFLFDSGV
jgi:template-activating factor I